jgi:predicted permease
MISNTDVNWGGVRVHDYEDMAKSQTSFEVFDAFVGLNYTFNQDGKTYQEQAFHVSDKFFDITKIRPVLGRIFTQSDMLPSAQNVVLITTEMWQNLYSSDQNIVGKNILIQQQPYTIVGVIPHVRFPNTSKLYLPYKVSGNGVARADGMLVSVYGRLKTGVSDARAHDDITQILNSIRNENPELNANVIAKIITFQENWLPLPANMILPMLICVVLILILSSVNVANLMFSRALDRKKEIAIRGALGETRQSLFAHVLLESVLICCISGLLGLVIANVGISVSLEMLSKSYKANEAPMWWYFSLTTGTVVIGLVVTIVTAVITGVLPALRSAFADINSVLRDGTRGAQSKLSVGLSKFIIIIEVGLSCALLIPSIALMYSVHEKNSMSYGASMNGLYTALIEFPENVEQYSTQEAKVTHLKKLEAALEKSSGIESVSYAQMIPLTWINYRPFALENTDPGPNNQYPRAAVNSVNSDYFSIMGIRLLAGRGFDTSDRINTQKVAVVTQNFVEQHFPDGNFLGKKVRVVDDQGVIDWHIIVGQVNDVIHGAPSRSAQESPTIFLNMEQNPVSFLTLVVRASLTPGQLNDLIASEAYRLDPANVAPFRYATSENLKERRLAFLNFMSLLFMAFAIASIVLAFTGIYGVMSHSIKQKIQEVGIRRALGATNNNITVHFLKSAGVLLMVGLMFGLPVGISLNHALKQSGMVELYPAIFAVIPIFIACIIVSAVLVPIGRTIKLEPISALRYE